MSNTIGVLIIIMTGTVVTLLGACIRRMYHRIRTLEAERSTRIGVCPKCDIYVLAAAGRLAHCRQCGRVLKDCELIDLWTALEALLQEQSAGYGEYLAILQERDAEREAHRNTKGIIL